MKNTPKISVITPAYNAEKYISETIESILHQTFKDFEYIIIDDCSTDKTWKIIQSYAQKDDRIVAVKNKNNLGIAGNRNKGVSLSGGKYVVWQDADDISLPQRLEKQYDFMESNPEVGICGAYLQFFDSNGLHSIRKYDAGDKELRSKIFLFSPCAQPASIIRKTCLAEVGEYDLKFPPAEDIDMSFRIGCKHKFGNIQEVLLKYREHPQSATFSKLKTIEINTLIIRRKYSKNQAYKPTVFDYFYNICQYLSIYIIPIRLKIILFNWIRNSK